MIMGIETRRLIVPSRCCTVLERGGNSCVIYLSGDEERKLQSNIYFIMDAEH